MRRLSRIVARDLTREQAESIESTGKERIPYLTWYAADLLGDGNYTACVWGMFGKGDTADCRAIVREVLG